MRLFNWLFGSGSSSEWQKIEELPDWVSTAYNRWESRLNTHPYNMNKHFVGKEYIYRIKHGMGEQGEAPIIGWYKKLRKK